MCRNIRMLNIEPRATQEEIRNAAAQYVRKISGIKTPGNTNVKAFNRAIAEITKASSALLDSLAASSTPGRHEAAEKLPWS
jgi:hypothetical protein